jgi:hypothetical protein
LTSALFIATSDPASKTLPHVLAKPILADLRPWGAVKAVRQQDNRLSLDFEDGGTWEIQTAEPTASVMVRDTNHTLEYAD